MSFGVTAVNIKTVSAKISEKDSEVFVSESISSSDKSSMKSSSSWTSSEELLLSKTSNYHGPDITEKELEEKKFKTLIALGDKVSEQLKLKMEFGRKIELINKFKDSKVMGRIIEEQEKKKIEELIKK